MLVFSTIAVLFVLQIFIRFVGALPPPITQLGSIWLLAQPVVLLQAVSRIRQVALPLRLAVAAVWLLTSLPLLVLPTPLPPEMRLLSLLIIGYFTTAELMVAWMLAREARSRSSVGRFRLLIAAGGAALFALAVMVVGLASSLEAEPALIAQVRLAGLITALLSGMSFLIAFLPPRWLRDIWRSGSVLSFSQQLWNISPTAEVGEVWSLLAQAGSGIGGRAHCLVVERDEHDQLHLLAASGSSVDRQKYDEWADSLNLLQSCLSMAEFDEHELPCEISEPLDMNFLTSVRIPSKDNQRYLILLAAFASLFRSDDSELLSLLAAQSAFMAERREMLARQENLIHELERASRSKSDFLSSMNHELRTPLSAIIGFSELMRSEPRRDGQLTIDAEWVDHVYRSSEHLLNLINDALDLSKVEAGRLEIYRSAFELGSVINDALAGMNPLAERKQLRLSSDVPPGQISADVGRMRQILYNLLSNAIKFTPDGGSVEVIVIWEPEVVCVRVCDSGIGISEEDQAHVFEEFRQIGDHAQRQSGTGLGLSLTRRLVEAHGGQISVESESGKGSTFHVWLPLYDGDGAYRHRSRPARIGGNDARCEVLIIENDDNTAELINTYLTDAGYEVRRASDGESGLAEARRRAPGAILLDLSLPGIDGWDVLREFKTDSKLQSVPVNIVSMLDQSELGLALGAADYFVKPILRPSLLAVLERFMSGDGRLPRVLAIDDDPQSRELIEAALAEKFEVVLASSGSEGLTLASEQHFDLVICDLIMPDLDGFGVITALRANEATRKLPVVMLTAHDITPAERQRLSGKIVSVIDKGPEAMAGLLDWLEEVVGPASEKGQDTTS